MFKKGQLVRITGTGELAVIFAFHKENNIYFAESLTGSYLTVLYAQDMCLIGNNFKFKGVK
jgi:hypothetical protein|nr:MAG TPA_asm: YdfZ protein [Caudoviricetes sp.]